MGLFNRKKSKLEEQDRQDDGSNQLITPLFIAAYNNDSVGVAKCLSSGADPNTPSLVNVDLDQLFTPAIPQKAGALILQQLMMKERHPDAFCELNLGISNLHYPALEGYKEVVHELLEAGENPDTRSLNGLFPLYSAAEMGHSEIIIDLLEHGADINQVTPNNCTALLNAAEEGHTEIVKLLLQYGADPDIKNKFGATPLDGAIRYQHMETAMVLMQQDTPGQHEWTLRNCQRIPEARYFVRTNAMSNYDDVNSIIKSLDSEVEIVPTDELVRSDQDAIYFITGLKGFPVPVNDLFENAMEDLAEDGHLQTLLDYSSYISSPVLVTKDGEEGYIWSCSTIYHENTNVICLRSVLEHLTSSLPNEIMGSGLLKYIDSSTIIAPVSETRKWLLDWYSKYISDNRAYRSGDYSWGNEPGQEPELEVDDSLAGSIVSGNAQKVKNAIDRGFDVNERYNFKGEIISPIVEAALRGNTEIVDLLLEAGANPNGALQNGETALAVAAQNGEYTIASKLLEAGADPNTVTPVGTAMAVAANIAIMQVLWSNNANPNIPDKDGNIPIVGSITTRTYEAVFFLRLIGTNLNERNENGLTPIDIAQQLEDSRLNEALLGNVYFSPESSVNISVIRDEVLGRIEKLRNNSYPASNFADTRIMTSGEEFSEDQSTQMDRMRELAKEATDAKRFGNLELANEYYIKAFDSDVTFNTDVIWGWVKVLLLAKNFRDARLVMRYYSAISARHNEFYEVIHPEIDLDHISSSARTFDFDGFTAFYEYTNTYPMDKESVVEKIRAFGGSAAWDDYDLTNDEYDYFLRCFGIDDLYVNNNVGL